MLRRDTMRPLLFTFLVAVNEANSRDWIFGVTIEVRGEKEGEIEIVIERERERSGDIQSGAFLQGEFCGRTNSEDPLSATTLYSRSISAASASLIIAPSS